MSDLVLEAPKSAVADAPVFSTASEFDLRVGEATRFLSVLFDGYESGYVEMRAFRKDGGNVVRRQDWKMLPLRSIAAFAAELVRLSDVQFDVYVGVLPRQEKRGTADSVKNARWMWGDFDGKNLKRDHLHGLAQAGDLAVNSGYGMHVYWSVTPMRLDSHAEREVFCRTMRMVQRQGSDGVADNVADLPRILRVPGTWNWKNGERVAVTLVKAPEVTREDIPEVIEPLGDDETLRIKRGVMAMISAADCNALPALYPAWRSSRGHIVNDPNVWIRGQVTWFEFMLKHQTRVHDYEESPESVRSASIVDACVTELSEDFTNLFLRLDSAGYDPTDWQNSPIFTLEDIGGN